jgi:hypothetical protein
MNISDRINYFADNLNLKFIKVNYIKLSKLEEEIRRYVKKSIKDNCLPDFTSQDLRILCIRINKLHKVVNKKIEFVSLDKRIRELSKNCLSAELNDIVEYIKIAEYLQRVYSMLNFLEMNLNLLEAKINNEKLLADEKFNDEIIDTINAFLQNI